MASWNGSGAQGIVCRHADQLRSRMDSCETQSNEVADETTSLSHSVDISATRYDSRTSQAEIPGQSDRQVGQPRLLFL